MDNGRRRSSRDHENGEMDLILRAKAEEARGPTSPQRCRLTVLVTQRRPIKEPSSITAAGDSKEAAQAGEVEDQEDLREAEVEDRVKGKAEGASRVEDQAQQASVAETPRTTALRGMQHRGHTNWQACSRPRLNSDTESANTLSRGRGSSRSVSTTSTCWRICIHSRLGEEAEDRSALTVPTHPQHSTARKDITAQRSSHPHKVAAKARILPGGEAEAETRAEVGAKVEVRAAALVGTPTRMSSGERKGKSHLSPKGHTSG